MTQTHPITPTPQPPADGEVAELAEWIPPHPAQPQVIVRPCDLGFGLFAGRPFAAEEHILVFTGPELSFESMVARGEAEANALQIDDCLYLDIGAPGVYANHSCCPNAGIRQDRQLVALRPIQAGEEIRYDYSTTMWEDHWTMDCRCGQVNCRRLIADFHTLPPLLQRRYLHLQVVQTFIVRRLRKKRTHLAPRQRPAAACGGGGVVKITYTFKKTHFDGTKEVMRFSDCTHQEAFDAAHRWGWTAPRWWQWWRWVDGPRKSCANALPTPEATNE